MDTIFINSKNSKIFNTRILLLNLTDKKRIKRSYVALSILDIYYPWQNIKKSYKNIKFKISFTTWNKRFDLPDGSYSVSGIQDYF